jgi:citrate synthase
MKPTLTNIERRVETLEKSRPAPPGPVVIRVSYQGTLTPDLHRKAAMSSAVAILPAKRTIEEWEQEAQEWARRPTSSLPHRIADWRD